MSIFGAFGSDNLIIRDSATGESRTFTASSVGYQQAAQFRESITSKGHVASDDNSGSLGRLSTIYPEHY